MNTVNLIGNLTRDAELKYTNNGFAIVNFALAWNQRKKENDTWKDVAHYFDCTYIGKPAESVHKYLTKGKKIGISAELRQESWEKDGQKRSRVKLSVNSLDLLSQTPGHVSADVPDQDEYTDDVPF